MDLPLKKSITKAFQLSGLSIKNDAMKLLGELNDNRDKVLELVTIIIDNIDKSTLNGNFVDRASVERCLAEIKTHTDINAMETEVLKVIGAFDCPLVVYDNNKKQYVAHADSATASHATHSLHADALAKASLYRRRYINVLQRVERHQFFSPPVLPNEKFTREHKSIITLNSLLGNPGPKYVLGTISQITEGRYYLEDLTTNVPLDISNALVSSMLTENSIVQAYGELVDGVFVAQEILLPVVEDRQESLRFLKGLDAFGQRPNEKLAASLLEYEQAMETNALVFMSDVWLDSPLVMSKLNVMFFGLKDIPPFAFILMGNFTEQPLIGGKQYRLKTYFDQLAALIQRYPNILAKSKFIFVPGPTDPAGSLINILPKFPIPDVFVKGFKSKVANSVFTTNPCRIRYCTQEIIVFREDIVNKVRRHCIKEPADQMDITQHVLESICKNAHLCNLPLEIRPIYWNYDHALSLYPLPDVLVLGDKFNQYEHNYEGTYCFNPSSFSTDFSFSHYLPAKRALEFCTVPDKVEDIEFETQDDEDTLMSVDGDGAEVVEPHADPVSDNEVDVSMEQEAEDDRVNSISAAQPYDDDNNDDDNDNDDDQVQDQDQDEEQSSADEDEDVEDVEEVADVEDVEGADIEGEVDDDEYVPYQSPDLEDGDEDEDEDGDEAAEGDQEDEVAE
ncbi:hypothetical protein SAMD00019534_096960 [Acytostelium subglobosum LB1]|uniref:hypothetical protein n=1 Tax=Acytostelium subglobosum LB1 TaxID=1410327 RepID=UPI000644F181|nr:hypothetical protein SAMD00019534_096960 [Acytostelium subglobosum LB1]GAM26521.1 hypothetical protein SAMD00019534_096960 [Acytostelium subglobosum LB1]|eukprot:XP_012750617.1 hypothetical protein SAMD00019534_096960 [Acytostelium subglobosum LB1]